ncbi:MAG TPA: endonuclease/exonuclease/phosphatase family protein [Actinomycetota bacterium]|jgi:endonuclease/exonuclease/phosphatase family metal-dependent hydrolase
MPLTVRVATFNVRHCEGLDGVVDVDRVARVVNDTDAELVALQELDRGLPRSGGVDQAAALAEATGRHVWFGATLHRQRGDYGIGLATVEPVDVILEPLPRAGEEEPRGVLRAGWRGVEVVATHLTRDALARPLQLDALARHARDAGPRALVMGDLNVEVADLGPLARAGLTRCEGRLPTLPARRPRRQIDHILAGPAIEITRCWTIATDASDHRPLVADVTVED